VCAAGVWEELSLSDDVVDILGLLQAHPVPALRGLVPIYAALLCDRWVRSPRRRSRIRTPSHRTTTFCSGSLAVLAASQVRPTGGTPRDLSSSFAASGLVANSGAMGGSVCGMGVTMGCFQQGAAPSGPGGMEQMLAKALGKLGVDMGAAVSSADAAGLHAGLYDEQQRTCTVLALSLLASLAGRLGCGGDPMASRGPVRENCSPSLLPSSHQ
jgi:hypothetical protein